jgi:hypothetical protein
MADQLEQYTETALAEVSPLLSVSQQLHSTAAGLTVDNDSMLAQANVLKKEINTHTKRVKDMRLDLTRPVDAFKDAMIAKEREILQPAEEAKRLLSNGIIAYEEQLEKKRAVENERLTTLENEILGHYKPGMTLRQIETARKRGKEYITDLPRADSELPRVKLALMTLSERLTARERDIAVEVQRAKKTKIDTEAEQAQIEAAGREAKQRLEAAELEADKAAMLAERSRPKSNIVETVEFEITDPAAIWFELCSPDERKIRAYIKEHGATAEIPGVRIFTTKKAR